MKSTLTEPAAQSTSAATEDKRQWVRHLVAEACEPVAQFWPMKNFVHHNPLHGLEHLPFDTAVREAKSLLGGNGYLSNSEYRQLHRDGRISKEGVLRALQRLGPRVNGHVLETSGRRRIDASEVLLVQLLFGISPLELTVSWTFGPGGATRRFQPDLPSESRQRILERCARAGGASRRAEEACVLDLWHSAQEVATSSEQPLENSRVEIALPAHQTIGDWLDTIAGASIVERTNEQIAKWVAAFVDEGMAGWEMPARAEGFYYCWRNLAPHDLSGGFLGIRDSSETIRRLPATPEASIVSSLERLGIPQERWTEYLSRHLAQLPGWAGFVRWLGENPDYPGQVGHPANAVEYLAVRLFYEVELADAFCRRNWAIPGTLPALVSRWQRRADEYYQLFGTNHESADADERVIRNEVWRLFRLSQFLEMTPADVRALTPNDVRILLGWLDSFPEDDHARVWLEAYEDKYREDLLRTLRQRQDVREAATRPRAQIVFCIDVRSESLRRHVEAQEPYETFGFAGFFGVAMNFQAFDSAERFPLCPVLLKPSHAVNEIVRPEQKKELETYASGTRWLRLADHVFHDLKHNPVAAFMLVDVVGFLFSLGLVGKTLAARGYEWVTGAVRAAFHPAVATRVSVEKTNTQAESRFGFTREEQAQMVENGLRAIGLTKNFGRFIVVCGHGSVTENNPYFGALHCGACGGKHGDPNARAFASMGNDPEIRRVLRDRGLDIPEDTWILAAKHLTTSDRVLFYDLQDVPASHLDDLRVMMSDLDKAGASQAAERCSRMPRAPKLSPEKAHVHVVTRTVDWANTRPEWGLSGNAAFLIGRRSLTKGLNLQGRVFLHSYNPEQDSEGKILEKIMTAPLIVGEWINMEHYFSGVDPWFWGSGSKVIHNVVSGVGVIPGAQGDLQTGLPLQTVNNGAAHYHEPMRLLAVIESPVDRISAIIEKHALLQTLFHNQWVNLVAVDPGTLRFSRYNPDGSWEDCPVPEVERVAGSAA